MFICLNRIRPLTEHRKTIPRNHLSACEQSSPYSPATLTAEKEGLIPYEKRRFIYENSRPKHNEKGRKACCKNNLPN